MRKSTLLLLIIIVAFCIGFLVGQYKTKRDIWTGFYYPDIENIDDQKTWIVSPPLYSLEECRNWVNSVRRSSDNSDYSCGKGCYFTQEYVGENVICRTDSK